MFYYLNGRIEEILPGSVVLEVNGVGFLINASVKTVSEFHHGQQAKLYITESIGESNYDLFGFADLQEKKLFELLISVSGVGPKAALSLLSSFSPDQLLLAIINEDTKLLTSAPGIGKKIAQRIALELRDKVANELPKLSETVVQNSTNEISVENSSNLSDAMAALDAAKVEAPFVLHYEWPFPKDGDLVSTVKAELKFFKGIFG